MSDLVIKQNKFKKLSEVDMVHGHIFKNMVKYCIPLILTGILQLLYNAADLVVVSNFSDEENALGAVGSTNSLINLIVNLFMGFSVGSNVLSARMWATKNAEGMKRTVATAIELSIFFGIILGIFGFIFARPLLELMDNPIDLSVTYLKIYFIGLPCNMLYNFCASILRGVGDTKRPLIFLSIAGIINVGLNLIFVIVFKMGVAGVATATIISQFFSCVFIMNYLFKTKDIFQFKLANIGFYKSEIFETIKIGFPAGLQSSLFSVSNTLIQSTVNKFKEIAINGNAATQSLEGFVYTSMNSVYHASLAFTAQNYSIKQYQNIKKILLSGLLLVTIVGVVMGGSFFLLKDYLIRIYTKVPEEIYVAKIRFHYLCLPYFICGIMDVVCGVIRGLGYVILPMVVSLIGACGIRLLWIFTIFNHYTDFSNVNDLNMLYISYPISWIITFVIHLICYFIIKHKIFKSHKLYKKLDISNI